MKRSTIIVSFAALVCVLGMSGFAYFGGQAGSVASNPAPTANVIAKYTTAQQGVPILTPSLLSDNGTTLSYNGTPVAGGTAYANIYSAGGGTAQAQTMTPSPALPALLSGIGVIWAPTAANTAAAPTLAISGLTAKPITKCGTAALVANDIVTTALAVGYYDGTEFQLLNPQASGCPRSAYATTTNCTSSASPAVCAAAAAGSVVVAAADTTIVVDTTAVTANSQIIVQEDASLGARLSVTCNATAATAPPVVTARTAATSFTITTTVPIANPRCLSYFIVN
jgi:hypothetical protein